MISMQTMHDPFADTVWETSGQHLGDRIPESVRKMVGQKVWFGGSLLPVTCVGLIDSTIALGLDGFGLKPGEVQQLRERAAIDYIPVLGTANQHRLEIWDSSTDSMPARGTAYHVTVVLPSDRPWGDIVIPRLPADELELAP